MAYRKIKKDGKPAKATRPLKVSEERFLQVVNDYIKECTEKDKPLLQTELAILLGIDTDTLNRYRQKPRYAAVLKRINDLSQNYWINRGNTAKSPLFSMFMLKAKHGFVEAQYQKIDMNVQGNLGTVQMPKKKPRISAD